MLHYTLFNKEKITSNTILALDTESTSFWKDKDGKFYNWDPNIPDEVYNEEFEKGSVCYIWMLGIEDEVYYGRELTELQFFLDTIKSKAELKNPDKDKIYIYVHNLAWDFTFLLNLDIEIENLFARQLRKVMKFTSGIFEFRCSYMLENLSLATWGEQVGIQKLYSDMDYNVLRTPKTPLFDYEFDYAEHDILIMLAGLKKEREFYKKVKSIPLTATGKVRKVVRKMYERNVRYLKKMTRNLPKNDNEYRVAHQIQNGGDTHANAKYVGKVLEGVESKDECSAYPYVMCVKGYPVGPFFEIKQRDNFNTRDFCYIFFICIKNIESVSDLSYLASSRCVSVVNGTYDNGRVHSADEVSLYCTEIDLPYIKKYYGLEEKDIEYITVRKARKGYLDIKYVEYILELFQFKSTLKGNEEMLELYMRSKGNLNALFGMMMTDIIQSKIEFDAENKKWKDAITQWEQDVDAKLEEMQEKWYKNFLNYYSGAWVTAHARAALWDALEIVSDDLIYYDTDSCKYKNASKYEEAFKELNQKRWNEIEEVCRKRGIDINKFKYHNNKKKIGDSFLGAWEYDGEYEEFKTLGAKKYCYRQEGELHITVSGVPKSGASCLNNDINNFKEDFVFNSETCRKSLATYLDGDNVTGVLWDGYLSTQKYGCNLRNIGYTLGIAGDFELYLQYMYDYGNIGE